MPKLLMVTSVSSGATTPTITSPTSQSTVSTTLADGAKCGPWQEQFPYAVLDFSDLTTSKNPTGCTTEPDGHAGEKNSICYLTCPDGYDFVWDDPSRPSWKTRASVECKVKSYTIYLLIIFTQISHGHSTSTFCCYVQKQISKKTENEKKKIKIITRFGVSEKPHPKATAVE